MNRRDACLELVWTEPPKPQRTLDERPPYANLEDQTQSILAERSVVLIVLLNILLHHAPGWSSSTYFSML
jgi:hypothetical protein